MTGFPPGTVIGMTHIADAVAGQAQSDLGTAITDAAGRANVGGTKEGDIGGTNIGPGVYNTASTPSLEITSGDLTLDASNDPNALFIFRIASTLTINSGRQIFLTNGARAECIFWQVGSSATLGTASVFKGTIMANQSITMTTGATLVEGRALARNAAVTLDSNIVTVP